MTAPHDARASVDPLGTGDPGPGVLAAALERILAQHPADHDDLVGNPLRLWPVAERLLEEVAAAREEHALIAADLDDVARRHR